jgi:abortive infection bacteriophage resistance protein
VISNEAQCEQILESTNYYRLTAYFLPFKLKNGTYREGTTLERVFALYEFDRKMHQVIFGAIEYVETYLRSQFAYYHAHKYGALGYENPGNFLELERHNKLIDDIAREKERYKRVLFVKHHNEHYNGKLPIWVAIELFSFGMLSQFYRNLVMEDKSFLAESLYNTSSKTVASWLQCCSDLRNTCAHYKRLYFYLFPFIPAGFHAEFKYQERRLFAMLFALKGLYPGAQKWNSEVLTSISAIVRQYEEHLNMWHIGFPEDWETKLTRVF